MIPFGLYYSYRQLKKKRVCVNKNWKLWKHPHTRKEEVKDKGKNKRKIDTHWCKGTKEKENMRKKKTKNKRKIDFEARDIEVSHR